MRADWLLHNNTMRGQIDIMKLPGYETPFRPRNKKKYIIITLTNIRNRIREKFSGRNSFF